MFEVFPKKSSPKKKFQDELKDKSTLKEIEMNSKFNDKDSQKRSELSIDSRNSEKNGQELTTCQK